ncbi:hypothetical protein Tco_0385207 [Tanacetum coccineum]
MNTTTLFIDGDLPQCLSHICQAQTDKARNKEESSVMAAIEIGRDAKMQTISSLPNPLRVITANCEAICIVTHQLLTSHDMDISNERTGHIIAAKLVYVIGGPKIKEMHLIETNKYQTTQKICISKNIAFRNNKKDQSAQIRAKGSEKWKSTVAAYLIGYRANSQISIPSIETAHVHHRLLSMLHVTFNLRMWIRILEQPMCTYNILPDALDAHMLLKMWHTL